MRKVLVLLSTKRPAIAKAGSTVAAASASMAENTMRELTCAGSQVVTMRSFTSSGIVPSIHLVASA